jgi:hypothetical protein
MQGYGLDLSSYADVKARASEIYEALANGSMPCDEAWTKERLELFKQWMDEGMNPGAPDAVSNPVLDRRRTPPPTQHNLTAISRDPAKSATHMSRQIRDPRSRVYPINDASDWRPPMIPSTPEVIQMAAPAPAKERRKERLSLEERIQRRAYELYVQRGNESGSELDDWLQAEEEIRRAEVEALDKR